MTEQIKHIAVIGAGYMGGGIAQVFGMAGMDVVIRTSPRDISIDFAKRLRTSKTEDCWGRDQRNWFGRTSEPPIAWPRLSRTQTLSKKRSSNGLTLRGQCCAALRRRPARTQ